MRTAVLVALALLLARPALAEAPAHVRFGIQTPNQNVAWDDLLAASKEAEVLGFASAWASAHFIPIFFAQDIMPASKSTVKSRAAPGFPASLTRPVAAGIFPP